MTERKQKPQLYPLPDKPEIGSPTSIPTGPFGTLERLLSVYNLVGDSIVPTEEVRLQKARTLASLVTEGRGEHGMLPHTEAGVVMNVARIFKIHNRRVQFGLKDNQLVRQDACVDCGAHVAQGTCKIMRKELSLPPFRYSTKDTVYITRPRIIFTLLPYAAFHLLADHETYEGGFERSGTITILPAQIEDFFTKSLEELGDMEELMRTMAEADGAFYRTYTQEQPK